MNTWQQLKEQGRKGAALTLYSHPVCGPNYLSKQVLIKQSSCFRSLGPPEDDES